jgi:hypothetical protein
LYEKNNDDFFLNTKFILRIVFFVLSDFVEAQSFNGHDIQVDINIFVSGGIFKSVIAGNIRNDGKDRIVAGTWQGLKKLHIYNYQNGTYVLEWDTTFAEGDQIIPACIGDADNDGFNEPIVTIPSSGKLYMFKWNGYTYHLQLIMNLDIGYSMSIRYTGLRGGLSGIVTHDTMGVVGWLEGNLDQDPMFRG